MPTTQRQTITVDGETLTVIVERKRVKNINARLRESTLLVSAPPSLSKAALDQAIADLARRLVRRVHAQRVNAEEDAAAVARLVAARFKTPPEIQKVIFVTTQRSRWGSYSGATSTIRLHAALRSMPRWVLEAVVAHELAHVIHPDHSPAFWALTRSVCPDTDRAQAFLAGVSWLAHRWESLPQVERTLLGGLASGCDE
jgi:predicted metal-dependent hydrolase